MTNEIKALGMTLRGTRVASGSVFFGEAGAETYVILSGSGEWSVTSWLYRDGHKTSVCVAAGAPELDEAVERFLVAAEQVPAIAARFAAVKSEAA